MSQPGPTFCQIRALVQAIRRKIPEARAVGIQSPGFWTGDRVRPDGADTYRIEQCDSSLAARIALLQEDPAVTVLVLVTNLPEKELGDDVMVRLAGRRLYSISPWQIVKELFQAQTVDPRLRAHSWIADRLLDIAAKGHLVAAPGGFLDAEVVWPLLLNRLIGLAGERPDLSTLLCWSANSENVHRYCHLPEEVRGVVDEWLTAQVGPAATAILRSASTRELPDALPIGLVLGVVHHPEANGRLDRAAGRMERFMGGTPASLGVVSSWHSAAAEIVRLLDADPRHKGQLLDRADTLLREVQAEDFAYLSDVLPRGFEQRLAHLGSLLKQAVEEGSAAMLGLLEARQASRQHDQARREPRRLERVEMALRLVRWLSETSDAVPQSLGEAAQDYLTQGSFVDWARSILRAGDPVRELSEGFARLLKKATARREKQNRSFAELLKDQAAAAGPPAGVMPLERALDEVVAPLAAKAPVLVILLDGMSPAVSRELLADLARIDWAQLGPGGQPLQPGLAVMPCVTEVSRTSLFSGRLCRGTAPDEVKGFAGHVGLRAHCRGNSPPLLFHKVALQEAADASLAANVREAIASTQKRVVGVVINAVDDHLLKGGQLDFRWTRDDIKVLPSLLFEARLARRVVVILSDHGHLLDYQTEARPGDGGERWRPDDGHPIEGELAVQGPRVLLEDSHRIIAPWTEGVRYGMKKNGYHGGLTPQEMLIPITVLAAGDVRLAGWNEIPDPTPNWWELTPSVTAPLAPMPSVKTTQRKKPETLWDTVEAEPTVVALEEPALPPDWLAALMASPLFADQKKLGGRAVPSDELFTKLLTTLESAGGTLTAIALARKLGLPGFRLQGLLAVAQKVLNIDGFAVLSRESQSDTVSLDRRLLLRQFDLASEDEHQ